jgi:hypothetical protein
VTRILDRLPWDGRSTFLRLHEMASTKNGQTDFTISSTVEANPAITQGSVPPSGKTTVDLTSRIEESIDRNELFGFFMMIQVDHAHPMSHLRVYDTRINDSIST